MIVGKQIAFLAASPPIMADVYNDAFVADRIRQVMAYVGKDTDLAFAQYIGISQQRLSNVLRGSPLSKDMAFKLVQRVPGLTTDWLWSGNARGMPLELVEALDRPLRLKTAP